MAFTSYFKTDDKLKDKSDYHAWNMTLDLTLEEHHAMGYVQGRLVEPPSNAPAVAKAKYKKGEVKAKRIIMVGIFKVNNANQILFLKNKLKDIKMEKGESIQSYLMRLTQIKNDLLSIGEVIADRELTLIALRGLSRPWDVFTTTILNNDRIPSFDELLARCT